MITQEELVASLKAARDNLLQFRKENDIVSVTPEMALQFGLADSLPAEIKGDNSTFSNGKMFGNRVALAKHCLSYLPENPVITEIGVFHGKFSVVLDEIFDHQRFVLIDNNFELIKEENMAVLKGEKFEFLEGDSSTMIRGLADKSIDYAYVDAAHFYEGVSKDTRALRSKLKDGAIVQFNDYSNWVSTALAPIGVLTAANEFINEHSCEVIGFSFCPYGLHDLAIRLPA